MIRILLSFISLLFFNINIYSQIIENVDAVKFKQLINSGDGIIFDVRTPGEVARGHIKGATNINIADKQFATKVNLMQKNKPIYIYCLTGSRSAYAAKYMAQVGFQKIYNLKMGILDWKRNNFPVEVSNISVASNSVQYNSYSFDKIITSNKLVLVDFHAVWCAPCKKMSPTIEKLKTDFKNKANVLKVDIEINKEISQLYNVRSVPTLILFKNGKEIWRKNGISSYEEIKNKLESNL